MMTDDDAVGVAFEPCLGKQWSRDYPMDVPASLRSIPKRNSRQF